MAEKYNKEQLRKIFQSPFNQEAWKAILHNLFHAEMIRKQAERFTAEDDSEDGYYLGSLDTSDSYRIGLFYFVIKTGSVAHKKVGLRNLVKQFINPNWGQFDAALVVFDDKTEWRLSFVCDIKDVKTTPKRYTFVFGEQKCGYKTPVSRFLELQKKGISFVNIKEAFSVEALSKDFYNRLYNWYTWALSNEINVTFPNNPNTEKDDRENINVKLIRLITRLLFVWFIKQKGLVPESIFDPKQLSSILADFDKTSANIGNYYNAILQNLFFATLNCAIIDDDNNKRRFAASKSNRDTRNLYRYAEMFRLSEQEVLELFAHVPFLNGGLFECLDKPKDLYTDQDYDILYDGFSRNATKSPNGNYKYRAFVPNILFFNDDEEQPGLINLLKQYNFTIEENSSTDAVISLDPELLGRVFENLLAAYNPETQESARKSTGSFYTPRPIVDYMVNEALKRHILSKNISNVTEEKLDKLINAKEVAADLTCKDKVAIIDALKQIKILDPACGSGAYPMGCLLCIVDIIELLSDNVIDRYQLKLDIIENCVYGVDIQPIAMLICKLRFFISLICEQNNIDFNSPETNFGINTLPNLETKFVVANTLLSAKIRPYKDDWTRDTELDRMKEELLEIRKEHFLAKGRAQKRKKEQADKAKRAELLNYIMSNAPQTNRAKLANLEQQLVQLIEESEIYKEVVWVDKTRPVQLNLFGIEEQPDSIFREDINKEKRDDIRKRIAYVKTEIAKEKSKGEIVGFEAAVKQITEWNPYDQNSISSFFDPDWMFGVTDGFDIVIGNPPYIQLQKNESVLANLYEKCGYETFSRKSDLYCLFYERGYQLLKEGGILCFITSNKWMRADYGQQTREFFFQKTNPVLLIDFGGIKVFESATVDTNVLLFVKGENTKSTICSVVTKQNKDSIYNLSDFVQHNSTTIAFDSADNWVILSPIELSIKKKIESVGVPLRDWDIQIYRGVLTGYNDAFIISTEKRNEILANCLTDDERQRTEELIRPILRGRDIKRYGYNWANLWLIATFPAKKYDIELYPAVKHYLLSFAENSLRQAGYDWVADNYLSDFCYQKLSQTGQHIVISNKRIRLGNSDEKSRKKTSNKWFETQDSISYWDDFSSPKVMYPNMTKYMPFYYDEKGFYQNDKSFMITGQHISFLVAFLNSSLFKYCFRDSFPELLGGTRELRKVFFDKIPVIPVADFIDEKFRPLVLSLQENFSISKAVEIDNLIFDMYGLSENERRIIGFIEF